jgi:hypothetical protein
MEGVIVNVCAVPVPEKVFVIGEDIPPPETAREIVPV